MSRPRRARGGTDRAPGAGIAGDDPAGDPVQRRRRRDSANAKARKPSRLRQRQPRGKAVQPIGEARSQRARVARRFVRHLDPQQRAQHARRAGEGLAGEQLAPRRADARVVSSICSGIARAERKSASSASCFCFSAASSGLAASFAAGSLRFRRQLGQPLGRGLEARRESTITAWRSTASGSASARRRARSESPRLSAFSAFRSRRSSCAPIERLTRRVLAGGVSRAPTRSEGSRAEDGRREGRANDSPTGDSAAAASDWHRTMAPPRRRPAHAGGRWDRSPWRGKKAASSARLC